MFMGLFLGSCVTDNVAEFKKLSKDEWKIIWENRDARLNIFEEPLIDVIELDNIPPVHDSANEIFSPFLINFLTIILIKFFIIKHNF